MSDTLNLKAHPLRDVRLHGWDDHIGGRWHYNDLAAEPNWVHGWISFDAITYNPADQKIYCGLNSIDGDLLYRFDPTTKQFTCLETRRWTDAFDAKIHRTLLLDEKTDRFYFATSLLHDADLQQRAPGGKLVCYDWQNGQYDVLGIPLPHIYVQSIALDPNRRIIYGFSYPGEFLFRYDLNTRSTRTLGYVGNALMLAQPHNAVVDKDGWLWGTYAETRAWDEQVGPWPIRLFKYHPDEDQFVWYGHGLSRKDDARQLLPDPHPQAGPADMTESRHKFDYGFCDSMCYDGNRYIYCGTVAGVLSRIDIDSGSVEKIAQVMTSARFPAMAFDEQGRLIGGGGMKGKTELCRFDPHTQKLETWACLKDPQSGEAPARIHELAVTADGQVFFGENDNHSRSSYLWSTRLP